MAFELRRRAVHPSHAGYRRLDFSTGSGRARGSRSPLRIDDQDLFAAKPWAAARYRAHDLAQSATRNRRGNIYECLQEGWKHDLRNTWWIVDYNRQSLDGVVREGRCGNGSGHLRRLRVGGGSAEIRRERSAPPFARTGGAGCGPGSTPARSTLLPLAFPGWCGLAQTIDGRIGDRGPVTRVAGSQKRSGACRVDGQSGRPFASVSLAAAAFDAIDHDRRRCSWPIRSKAGARRWPATRTIMRA